MVKCGPQFHEECAPAEPPLDALGTLTPLYRKLTRAMSRPNSTLATTPSAPTSSFWGVTLTVLSAHPATVLSADVSREIGNERLFGFKKVVQPSYKSPTIPSNDIDAAATFSRGMAAWQRNEKTEAQRLFSVTAAAGYPDACSNSAS